tara:strand:+ start:3417 stop:4358 length:942 start_codon:yes stop_codon:yes gene_type:complete
MNLKKSIFLGIIAIIALYAIFLIMSDVQIISEKINNFNQEYLLFILPLIPLSWGILFLRWHFLLKNSEMVAPYRTNFLIFISGFALGITPGKVGELIKSQLLKDKFNFPRTKSAPIVIVEKFYDFFAIAIISFFGLWFFEPSLYVFLFLASVIIIFYLLTSSEKVFLKFLSVAQRIKFLKNFTEQLPESFTIIKNSTRNRIFPLSLSLSIAFWFTESVIAYLVMLSFDVDILDTLEFFSIYITSIILGVISFLPLGIGVVEGSLVGFLTMHGIEFNIATTLVVFIRLFTRWIAVSVGFIALKLTNFTSNTSTE